MLHILQVSLPAGCLIRLIRVFISIMRDGCCRIAPHARPCHHSTESGDSRLAHSGGHCDMLCTYQFEAVPYIYTVHKDLSIVTGHKG